MVAVHPGGLFDVKYVAGGPREKGLELEALSFVEDAEGWRG